MRLFALTMLLLSPAACSDLVCGVGTQRQQQPNGSVACVPTATTPSMVKCDPENGVQLQAGDQCVAQLQCGAGTILDVKNQVCVPSGESGPHEPKPCPPVTAGHICITGVLRHFVDGAFLDAAEQVHVALYDPVAFLNDPKNAKPIAEFDTSDTYLFADVSTPGSGLISVAAGDPTGAAPIYERAATSSAALNGQGMRIDALTVTVAQVAAWSSSAGKDYDATGAYVTRFFSDPKPMANMQIANEANPVAGVSLIDTSNGTPPPGVKYFGATLGTIDPALTSTGASGGAIVVPMGTYGTFSGSGGGIAQWEARISGAVPHTLALDRLHPAP